MVVAVAYDRLCAFELGVATELFGLARPELGIEWYDFRVASADRGPLRTLGGLMVSASHDLSILPTAGTIVLPGWRDPAEEPPDDLLDGILAAHESGARVMSICSGVFVLAATGLLDGKAATTHWRYTDQLAALHPAIDVRPGVLYVDNGSTLTSAGSAAGIDLGLHLIRRDHGAAIAAEVARRLVVPPQRDGDQAQYIRSPVPTSGPWPLAATVDWALGNLAEPLTVDALARHANMAPRTFARRFRDEIGCPPHEWLVRQRLALAQELLETTALPIDEVAAASGFTTGATLRHHFNRELRTTPTRYRSTFRTAAQTSGSGRRLRGGRGRGR
jgi:AraC family transcriptional activator FtrA